MTLYLDTSLLVAALTNEPDTPRVQKWFRQVERQDITISDLVVTEMSSSLSIKVRTGQIGLAVRAAALARFTRLITDTFSRLPIERALFQIAANYADQVELCLRAGDSLHLAVCAEYGLTLCTLDKRLAEAAPAVGVPVIVP